MSEQVTKEQVLDMLQKVKGPDGEGDIVSLGLVSEIVAQDRLWDRAHEIAAAIAAKHPAAVQATVRAAWESLDQPLSIAFRHAPDFSMIGNPIAQKAGRGGGARGPRRVR